MSFPHGWHYTIEKGPAQAGASVRGGSSITDFSDHLLSRVTFSLPIPGTTINVY